MQYQTGQSIPARHDWPGAVIPIRCVLCHSPHWLFWPSWDLRELLFSLCGGRNSRCGPLVPGAHASYRHQPTRVKPCWAITLLMSHY